MFDFLSDTSLFAGLVLRIVPEVGIQFNTKEATKGSERRISASSTVLVT
jgi:hypothetical protein